MFLFTTCEIVPAMLLPSEIHKVRSSIDDVRLWEVSPRLRTKIDVVFMKIGVELTFMCEIEETN